ncbi:MAG: hypothetical protein JO086_04000, partial [Acidimicrobiia bacterium]|nr:hypothetical protein [Acidimicrobiia bacterium]
MPDLSNLLGAVYGDGPSSAERDPQDEAHVEHEPAAEDRGPKVPDWADDDHLDAAFAEWKPGPAADASPAEHAFVRDTDDPAPPLADDLAAALSEALVAASGTADATIDEPQNLSDLHDTVGEREEAEPEDAPEINTWAPKRAAAAELTAASRLGSEPVVAEPESNGEPVGVAPAPVAVPEASTEAIAVTPAATTLPGTRRWDRS